MPTTMTALPRWVAAIAVQLALLAVYAWLSPRVSIDPLPAYVIGFGSVVAGAITIAAQAPVTKGRLAFVPAVPAVIALLIAWRLGVSNLGSVALVAFALYSAGTCIGAQVGRGIEHPGHLLFVVMVSALADVFSVSQPEGPSAAIANAPAALALLAVSWPMLGTDSLEPMLGVGDIVFTALYLAASRVHGLPMRRTVLALATAFLLTMVTVIVTEAPVPALPFLGLAMLIAHPATRKPPEKDRARAFTVVAALALVLAVLLARRFF